MYLTIVPLSNKRFINITDVPNIITNHIKKHSNLPGKLRFEIRDNTLHVTLHSWNVPSKKLQTYVDHALEYAPNPIEVPEEVSTFWAYFVYTFRYDNLYAIQRKINIAGNSYIIWDMSTNSQLTKEEFSSLELALIYLG